MQPTDVLRVRGPHVLDGNPSDHRGRCMIYKKCIAWCCHRAIRQRASISYVARFVEEQAYIHRAIRGTEEQAYIHVREHKCMDG